MFMCVITYINCDKDWPQDLVLKLLTTTSIYVLKTNKKYVYLYKKRCLTIFIFMHGEIFKILGCHPRNFGLGYISANLIFECLHISYSERYYY